MYLVISNIVKPHLRYINTCNLYPFYISLNLYKVNIKIYNSYYMVY